MTLINGPYNDHELADNGTELIHMPIGSPRIGVGNRSGEALYEPTPDREQAFWLCNTWQGKTLELGRMDDLSG